MKTADLVFNTGVSYAFQSTDGYGSPRQAFPLTTRPKGQPKSDYWGGGHGMDIIGVAVEVDPYRKSQDDYVPSWRFEWVSPKEITQLWVDHLEAQRLSQVARDKREEDRKAKRRANLARAKALPAGLLAKMYGSNLITKDSRGDYDYRRDQFLDGQKVSVYLSITELEVLTKFFAQHHGDDSSEVEELLANFNVAV